MADDAINPGQRLCSDVYQNGLKNVPVMFPVWQVVGHRYRAAANEFQFGQIIQRIIEDIRP